ncbi:cell division ATP-binding protein FtsE, partial [Candidatus Dojkabacteria bacterium]|nr:cell division ATP-binding protein FtsE [Candidatus Dojkabacteria bacterium]
MIQYLNVSKKYDGDIIAIDDITFQIDEGEFLFLVGSSGSGKTTVIRLLIREEKPTSGKIYFEDAEVTNLKRKHIYNLRRKVGVIFQDFKLIPELTAYENIAFAMEAAGKNDKEIKEKVPYLLEIVGLENRFKSFPYQLSGGEKQRVAIARAMANNPKLLIADEPTGNLDPDTAWDILQILSKINSWGTTVIMSTHESDFVNTLHKRVLKLENGKIIRDDKQGNYFEDLDEFSIKILQKDSDEAVSEDLSEEKEPET